MTDHVRIRSGAYADSVTLLQVSKRVAGTPGITEAQVAMATALNLDTLAAMGFDVPAETSPNDMVVALRLAESTLEDALAAVDEALAAASRPASRDGAATTAPARTTASALREAPRDAVVLVSVPGASALPEAMDAVEAGHDVMIFSDNVPLEAELALKRAAAGRDVLVMGPDCGTALVGGVGLGFANTVRPGPVGVVAASGTGTQQIICLLDQAGVGVSAALGVGGRDLSQAVGGLATRTALARLDADPATSHVVLVSKPPAPEVAEAITSYAQSLDVPVELALLSPGTDLTARTEAVLTALDVAVPHWRRWGEPEKASGPGFLRGLFVGGTLCDEAMLIAADVLGPIRSNIPLAPELALDTRVITSGTPVDAHTMVDFGDDALTVGRAHPMIDPTLRLAALARAAEDPTTAVVLLDVVLGHGAEPDPAAALAPAVADARTRAAEAGRTLPVVVSLIGTDADPQGLDIQADALAAAGAYVLASNAEATRHALDLVTAAGAPLDSADSAAPDTSVTASGERR
ncbi:MULTISPECIES: FdrA family protein [Mumia]|uniref:FdrA family protein n=1 Tax=Mumia TaxID=1546255 RepID=UPI001424080B|nr:FdrA family protein [Mumia sp. ZJ1417]QMW67286.1 FdrA family protein [Mumia sp. ZJ1417]